MNEAKEHFEELKDLASDYMETRIELVKLEATEKVSRVAGAFFTLLLLLFIFFIVLISVSIVAGAYLNSVLDSVYGGYLIVAGAYLIGFFILMLNKNRMEEFFMSKMIQSIYKNHNTNEAAD